MNHRMIHQIETLESDAINFLYGEPLRGRCDSNATFPIAFSCATTHWRAKLNFRNILYSSAAMFAETKKNYFINGFELFVWLLETVIKLWKFRNFMSILCEFSNLDTHWTHHRLDENSMKYLMMCQNYIGRSNFTENHINFIKTPAISHRRWCFRDSRVVNKWLESVLHWKSMYWCTTAPPAPSSSPLR